MNKREYWEEYAWTIINPVLTSLDDMPIVQHPGQKRQLSSRLEALSRVLASVAPWSKLAPGLFEKCLEAQVRFFKGTVHIPEQSVVDFGYMAFAYYRNPRLFTSLDETTQSSILSGMRKSLQIEPIKNNWVALQTLTRSWISNLGEENFSSEINQSLEEIDSWYYGDGVYGDGIHVQNDYYNSLATLPALHLIKTNWIGQPPESLNNIELKLNQYAIYLERLISPTGTYPIIGRSITYRAGVFHALTHAILEGVYTTNLGGACAALTAVLKQFEGKLTEDNFMKIGFMGTEDLDIAENYISTGSLYMFNLVFLVLGLAEDHQFWTQEGRWTQLMAWNGEKFPRYKGIGYI